jgi:hypothetical protein
MNVCFENVKVTSIDAQAIERAIATWCLPKEQGGRGLSQTDRRQGSDHHEPDL